MPAIEVIRSWFLETIAGVILLGALGSLLAWLLLILLKRLARPLGPTSTRVYYAVVYRFFRQIEVAGRVRALYSKKNPDADYLVFLVFKLAAVLTSTMLAFFSTVFMLAIGIVYRLDRPMLLAVSLAVWIPSVIYCLRQGAAFWVLTGNRVSRYEDEMGTIHPKR